MSVHETEPELFARDIMSRPPITARETDSVMAVSKAMMRHDIGCVIIVDKGGKPMGIVTERDIVQRVAAKNILPSDVKVGDTMSKPVISVSPRISVNEAAKRMNSSKIRRLVVIDDGKLVGVLTMKDIIEVTPALIDLISEQNRVGGIRQSRAKSGLSGYCDECETWSDHLIQKEGVFICQDCSKDLDVLEER